MDQAILREEQIFMQAIEIEDSMKQQEFLVQACNGDIDLEKKLGRMLDLHQRQDNILDYSSDSLFWNREDEEDPITAGTEIGPYKLRQQIGIGGMGVVFEAQQTEPVDRMVAVKIVKCGFDSRSVIARFESERQTLAMMDHPHITKFLDAGITQDGRPYFVMELIEGLPITKYADLHRLGPRQRMELFSNVCNAIQHAHQKGVIHRDIKPSNILVTEIDSLPIPKIIDFGIAKAIDRRLSEKTLVTSYGNIIGTPEYMSPEQAELNGLDVDACSDIYSLGVLLYELMTGMTPLIEFKGNGLLKFCDAICNVEPALASTCVDSLQETRNEVATNRSTDNHTLRQFLKGDVDWILAKCLAKRRENRYPTAAALAADVERYLADEPVLAGAPSTSYRLKKFLVRHKIKMAVASTLAGSLLVATVVSLSFALRAQNAEKLANQNARLAQESQRIAEAERDRALVAESRIRELEQASRLEASSAKAAVRYLSQEHSEGNQAEQSAADEVIAPSQPMRIAVAPNGNISMLGADGEFKLVFAVRSQKEPLAEPTRDLIQQLGESGREQARKLLLLVADEFRKRFGQLDLYVAEPLMMVAELEMQDGKWDVAEQRVRHIGRLFVNNFSHRELRIKNQLLLAVNMAKQESGMDRAMKLLQRSQDDFSQLMVADESLRNALVDIRMSLAKKDKAQRESSLERSIKRILELDDIVLNEVFESMEIELQKRAKTIRTR